MCNRTDMANARLTCNVMSVTLWSRLWCCNSLCVMPTCLLICCTIPLLLQVMLDLVSSNLQHCETQLQKLRAAQPRTAPNQQRLLDFALLILAGAWFYGAWGWGNGGQGLRLNNMVQSVGLRVLPAGYDGLEKALVFMLLLAAMSRVILVRTS